MPVELTAEQQTFLQAEVEAGRYTSVDAAVHDAINRLWQDRQREELRRLLDEGLASLERGDVIEINSDEEEERFFQELAAGLPE